MTGTLADITDIKDKQEQQRMLAIMKEREDFMATLTHDMKNPLIGANRLLELLVMGCVGTLTAEQCEMLLCLKDSNASLLKLIEDLMDVYRFEKDVSDLVITDCDMVRTVNFCLSRLATFAKLGSIKVSTELPAEMFVRVDINRLERVIQNLLDNALKFTPDDGRGEIHIRLFKLGSDVIIEIQDNGPGIALEEQSRLFKRFSQGAAGRRYAGGSGLGLYLCKQIVEGHGGTIECESRPNESTIFRVTLPSEDQKHGASQKKKTTGNRTDEVHN